MPSLAPCLAPHYSDRLLANGVKQHLVSDPFCGSTVEKVFAADSSLRGSRPFSSLRIPAFVP